MADSPAFTAEEVAHYYAAGWWSNTTLSGAVRRNAQQAPDRPAYVDYLGTTLTWREFDAAATALAGTREVSTLLHASQPKLLITDHQHREPAAGMAVESLVLHSDPPRLSAEVTGAPATACSAPTMSS